MLDPVSAQRPLHVVRLQSYPVFLPASVWTWLAVAVAGVWIWRLLSHQSARNQQGVRLTAASHLLPPETETTVQRSWPPSRVADLLCSPSPASAHDGEAGDGDGDPVGNLIEPACSRFVDGPVPLPAPALEEEASCRKAAAVLFGGHGGRCRRGSSSEDDDRDLAVNPLSDRRWCWGAAGGAIIRCWEDVYVRGQDEDDNAFAESVTSNMWDLGCRRFQDWRMINGNVVRLWEAAAPAGCGCGCCVPSFP